jgi:hypothetical protein
VNIDERLDKAIEAIYDIRKDCLDILKELKEMKRDGSGNKRTGI